MYSLLAIVTVIAAILLVIIVLLQSSKGGGLAGISGGVNNIGTMFGSRRTADFLSKSTWWLGSFLLGLPIIINIFFLPGQTTSDERESIIQSGQEQTVPTTPALPPPTSSDETTDEGTSQEQ
jgi:preprotein translocase subunit SecG